MDHHLASYYAAFVINLFHEKRGVTMTYRLPESIRRIVGSRPYKLNEIGMSSSSIIEFDDMVLKIELKSEESDAELQMLSWLNGKLTVPEILAFESSDGTNYLLMSKAAGLMACAQEMMQNPENLVDLLAQGMKELWKIDVKDCPRDNRLESKLKYIEHRVDSGLYDIERAEKGTFGEGGFNGPNDLLKWLKENKPSEDLVLAHGDYCLPNVFLDGGKVSGYIDLGRCGIADRYQDIALCYRSLKHNYAGYFGGVRMDDFNPDMIFEKLGIEPDWEKIKYYLLLDELM